MRIDLTPAQWIQLQGIVIQGRRAQRRLGLPIELVNGEVSIEITANETTINLIDEE